MTSHPAADRRSIPCMPHPRWTSAGPLATTSPLCLMKIAPLTEKRSGRKRTASATTGECWPQITGALHDELLIKVAHVERGRISSLLAEIGCTHGQLNRGGPAHTTRARR